MYRYHKDLLNVQLPQAEQKGTERNDVDSIMEMDTQDQDQDEEFVTSSSSTPLPKSITTIGAEFILKTQDARKLTQVATDGIIADSKVLVQS